MHDRGVEEEKVARNRSLFAHLASILDDDYEEDDNEPWRSLLILERGKLKH